MINNLLSNVLAFIVAVGVIIFAHELGHFLIGRLCGVRVRTFSLGFGPRLFGLRRGDTDYRVSVLPLGGYVLFYGLDPSEGEPRPGDLLLQPRSRRIAILLAGPLMNVALAILLVAGVFMAGAEVANPRDLPNEVGAVAKGSPAERAGLQAGDRVVAIDGRPTGDWQAVAMEILTSPERTLAVEIERAGARRTVELVPSRVPEYDLGEAGVFPSTPLRIAQVLPGTPAQRAGLRYADALLQVDRRAVNTGEEFTAAIAPRVGQPVEVLFERNAVQQRIVLVPELIEGRGRIGIAVAHFEFRRYPLLPALRESVRYNWDMTTQIGSLLRKLWERRISARSVIGGPIQIAQETGAAARRGWRELVLLMALISVNLFLINMLPIPVLDGGQILTLLVESVLGRDLPNSWKERLVQVGLAVIVTLMAMALFFDLTRRAAAPSRRDGATTTVPSP